MKWNLGYQLLKRMVFKFAASAKQHRIRSELLPDVDKCAPAKLDYGEIINLEQLLCYCIEYFNKSHFVLCDWSHGVCPVGQMCPAAVVWQWLMTPGLWCTTRCINTIWLITKTDLHSCWICLAKLLEWWRFSVEWQKRMSEVTWECSEENKTCRKRERLAVMHQNSFIQWTLWCCTSNESRAAYFLNASFQDGNKSALFLDWTIFELAHWRSLMGLRVMNLIQHKQYYKLIIQLKTRKQWNWNLEMWKQWEKVATNGSLY